MTSKIIHHTLPNGLEIYLHPTDFAPVVSLQVLVKVGSIDEEDDEGGMAHVLEHMLFKGTKKFPEMGQVASMVEAAGGDVNAYTTFDHTNYYLTAPSNFNMKGAEILLDVVQNSLLDADELKKELEVVLEEIKRGNDNPNSVMSHSLFAQAYKGTRLGRPVIGYVDVVKNFQREKIVNFYKKWYAPQNMIFIAAGDFDEKQLFAHIEALTAQFKSKPLPERVRVSQEELQKLQTNKKPTAEILLGDWQESRVQFAMNAPELESVETPVWDMLSAILGENDSSRLVRVVRNDLGLVTGIEASCFTPKYPMGIFSIGFLCPAQNTMDALKSIVHELEAIAEVKPSRAELFRVSNALTASRVYDQESVDGLTRNASLQLLTSLKMNFETNYLNRIATVTGEEVQKVAQNLLKQIEAGTFSVSCALDKNSKDLFSASDLLNAIQKSTHVFEESEHHASGYEKLIITSEHNKSVKQLKINLPQNKVLKINFRESKRLPITSGMLVFRGGLLAEEKGKNGSGALLASMLTRGTERQNYRSFVEELEDNAASVSAFSSRDLFGVRFESLAGQSLRTLQMMLDCLFRPEFASVEWDRIKRETLEIITVQKDSPSTQLSRIIQPLLYPNHPYQNTSLGTYESVSNLELLDIRNLWQNLFSADEYIFSIAGDFSFKSFVRLLETEFSIFFTDNTFEISLSPKRVQATLPTIIDNRTAFFELNREQCHLMLCFRGVDVHDERRIALEVAANILAGQGGRLFLDLRDQKSLAYSLSASQSPHLYGGTFATYIACATHKVKEAFDGLKAHLELLAVSPPSHAEVERARQSLIGAQSIESQHASFQASQLGMSDVYGLGFDHFLKFEERLNRVKPETICEVLSDLLKHNPPIVAAVGARNIWFPEQTDELLWTLNRS